MKLNQLAMRSKFILLSALICIIFIVAMAFIKVANNQIAAGFERFYQHNFMVTKLSADLKQAQDGILSGVRGLQVVYLLGLKEQAPELLNSIDKNVALTMPLIQQISQAYKGEANLLIRLKNNSQRYEQAAIQFKQAMESAADNKADYAIYREFVDSHNALTDFFDEFEKINVAQVAKAQAAAQQSIDFANTVFYLSILIALGLAVLFSHMLSQKVVMGLTIVSESAHALQRGELDHYSQVEGEDEVADLSRTLDATIRHLNTTLATIHNSVAQVNNHSDELLSSNTQIQTATSEVSDHTTQAVTAIEELSVTSKSIAVNTAESATASDSMMQLAKSGLEASEQTKEAVSHLLGTLNETSDVVDQLQSESSKIETILDVIRNISEQTNLLALNAAIEAARAGEQGRGFAVVADEVRTLAQRSHSSVNEIETMLGQLRSASQNAVTMMADSTRVAAQAEDKMDESNRLLKEIMEMINQVNDQTQQIATAAEEQSAVAADISQNMHTIHTLTDTTADISQQTANTSNSMAEQSQLVLKQVAFFKLN
ncbi:methyl-accepting chemotaxis protein [Pseudoalteromonas haloplanktis]|uniref:Methyl-accepting chemotaxis protein n=1 Tax=Pseudoalteromonas haloplanktis TaxID=228 RepID=A0ABU1BCM1_PSEHA|nr:methyl-accepting chemotaxis protein [Pseudoalteromonas haloplanktis]MDQ9091997.1 methyl-accepting chemotaxis protein [Pseudoalteromonas haloplanktis]